MKRNNPTNTPIKMTRKAQPKADTSAKPKTPDVKPHKTKPKKKLGPSFESLVPPHLRNVIPESDYAKNGRKQRTKAEKQKSMAKHMVRKLAPLGGIPLPYGMQPDDDMKGPGESKFRLKGLNQARLNAMLTAFRKGATVMIACQLAGVHFTTYNNWMKKGEAGKFPYVYVCQLFKEAQAELQTKLLDGILTAGLDHEQYIETTKEATTDPQTGEHTLEVTKQVTKLIPRRWQALAWHLERTNPEFRLNREIPQPQTGNTPEDDLLIMRGLTLGEAESAPKQQSDTKEAE